MRSSPSTSASGTRGAATVRLFWPFPTCRGDSALAFPSSLSGDEAKFYRAWWAVAHLFNEVHERGPARATG